MNLNIRDIDASALCQKWNVSPLCGKLIQASGISEEQIRDLLQSDEHMGTSHAECVLRCAERIRKARENHEKVFVAGDYDADGINATAIMKDLLDCMGIPNGYYIPDRFREGYGLSAKTVEAAAAKGYSLIITVDNGVKAFEAIEKAKALGLEIIVTDHHQIDGEVPADLVVHPDYMEAEYAYLSGAGVALEISRNLLGDVPSHTAMAAVAAVGDVMPLFRETRKLVKNGLQALRNNAVPAYTALMRKGAPVDWNMLGFQIVPKLNAVGRMNDVSNVNTLVKFLLAKNPSVIAGYATQLEVVNNRRKELSRAMSEKAESLMNPKEDFLVIHDPGFHEGICGLAAGRIASTVMKPVLILAENGDLLKGSGRSVDGFDMFSFFSDFECLTAFGGHEMAVGLSLKKEDYPHFVRQIREKMKAMHFVAKEPSIKAVRVDPDEITVPAIMDLSILDPMPKEIRDILFAVKNPEIVSLNKGAKVIKYHFANRMGGFDALAFPWQGLEIKDPVHAAAGRLSINRWRSSVTPQMSLEVIE